MSHHYRPELQTPSYSPLSNFLAKAGLPLTKRMFRPLSWADLTNLSCSSRVIRDVVLMYRFKAWNITTFLRFFVDDVTSFRAVMAFSGALLTGAQIVRFFDRLSPASNIDLDIVARIGGVVPLILFLESTGYTRRPEGPSLAKGAFPVMTHVFQITSSSLFMEKGGATGVASVIEYWRPSTLSHYLYNKVRILVVTQPPIEHIILGYHSTGAMNFVSHNEAVSIFPVSTFVNRVVYPCSRDDLGAFWDPRWAIKFREYGFDVETNQSTPPVFLGIRRPKDKMSWVIRFYDWEEEPRIKREEERSVYGGSDIEEYEFDIVWMSEVSFGVRHWRIAIFEPKVFWYLVPTFLLRGS